MHFSGVRTRWAAVGAAVAVTLGAGGIGLVAATSPTGATVYQPITPCRMADTRSSPAFNVGDRNTPLGPDETHTIAAVSPNDECGEIPKDVAGLQLNVTAVGATSPTFLTIWGDGDQPNASGLNPVPGQPPTPNAVTTGLDAAGQFHVFNKFGFVDVIIDAVGIYTDHNHDDRYYTKAQIDRDLPFVVTSDTGQVALPVPGAFPDLEPVAEISISVPGPGHVTVRSQATAQPVDASISCLLVEQSEPDPSFTQFTPGLQSTTSNIAGLHTLNGVGVFESDGRSTLTVELRCVDSTGTGVIHSTRLVAMFTPDAA